MSSSTCLMPPAVRTGDTICVVAPAGPVNERRLATGLAFLRDRFRVRVADDIGRRSGFLAGDDARRAEEFNAALRDPDVRGIWVARGGYGCSRIVSDLDASALLADPVPIVGFSDATTLLAWAYNLGICSIHGPVITQLGDLEPSDVAWVMDMVMKKSSPILAKNLQGDGGNWRSGPLLGGNLSLLAHLCGTPWYPNLRGALCVLEDVGERPYALDRYLGQLLAQGVGALDSSTTVLLGEFAECTEPADPITNPIETLVARLEDAQIPAVVGLPVGHGRRNCSFPIGAQAMLTDHRLELVEW